jgi:hypothetical protein
MDYIEGFLDYINKTKEGVPQTDAPTCYMTAIALMSLACVAKKNYVIKYGSKVLTPNLWCLLLGKSSFFRKSTSLEIGHKIISGVDPKCVLPNDFSIERLVGILDDNPQGVFVIDEFEAFYKQFGRSYMTSGLALITSLYDRDTPYVRKLQEIEYNIVDPFLNMLAATTIQSFENTIKLEDVHSGFLPRWFFIVATRKDRNVELPGTPDPAREKELLAHLSELRKHKQVLTLSPQAELFYKKFYNFTLQKYKKDLGNGLSPFITRLLTSCLKFAILYHISYSLEPTIQEAPMQKACAYTSECIENARKLLRAISIDQFQQIRRTVIYCLWNMQQETETHWVSKTELLRELRMPKSKLDMVLETLEAEGTIICDSDKPTGGGRTKTIYQITKDGAQWEGIDND